MQLPLDALLVGQLREIRAGRCRNRRRHHVAKAQAAIPQPGKQTLQIRHLLYVQWLSGNLMEWQWHGVVSFAQ